jgi:hypothetical protein
MLARFMTVAALPLAVTLGPPAAAEDLKTAIVGTWKMDSFVRKELATGTETRFYGERPTGYSVYTPGGKFFVYVVGEGRQRPAAANATDAERAALYNSMYSYSGTYRVEGNKLVYQLDGSWNEVWTGTQRTVLAAIEGNRLTINSMPFKGGATGVEVVVTNTFERVE